MTLEQRGFNKDVAGPDFPLVVEGVTKSINENKGLLLVGECGCGKTHLLKVLNGMPSSRQSYWFDCGDHDNIWLLDSRQNHYVCALYDMNCFIDDLGVEVKVEFGRRVDWVADFIRLYHSRGHGKLFISTNLNSKKLMETYDERIVDRLMQMCVVVKFNEGSHRERNIVK